MKIEKYIPFLILIFLLGGCATPPTYEPSSNFIPQDSRGAVVIYWHQASKISSMFRNIFGLERLEVIVDDKKIGEMKPNTHAVFGLKKGEHSLNLHVANSSHDQGVKTLIDVGLGKEFAYDIETNRLPSASTHYVYGDWDANCGCFLGGGDEPDYYYYTYAISGVKIISKEGLSSERSFIYIEP